LFAPQRLVSKNLAAALPASKSFFHLTETRCRTGYHGFKKPDIVAHHLANAKRIMEARIELGTP
jgi:hypothetical protein